MKICTKCKVEKPKSEFGKDKRNKDGLQSGCKACKNKQAKEWHETPKGKEIRKNSVKKYRKTPRGREKSNNIINKWRKTSNGKESHRNSKLKYKYGITIKQYNDLLDLQHGVCAICGTNISGGSGNFHVDHDHITGQVRGLLCTKCNTGVGLLNHDPKILINAAQYLNRQIRST